MGVSVWQILIVVVVVLLLFGAGRLPRLMGDMAKGIKSFKQGMKEDVAQDDERPADPERLRADQSAKSAQDKDRAANS
jgi:sec-independent protein translocase protein TatA